MTPEPPSDRPRPNILLIVSDDHGYGDLSARTHRDDVRTPQLDRLVAEGVLFENGYVTAPICSPSRAGLIAGAHQQRWGAHWFDDSRFPPPEHPSIARVLADAGYRTGYLGKIHYGPDTPGSPSCPEQHGFQESFYGLAAQSMGRLHYQKHSARHVAEYGEAAAVHGVAPMLENGREVDCDEHLTAEFARRAVEFMSPGEDPFFCMVAFNAVHNFAWQLPADELDARGLPTHPDFDPSVNDYLDWYDGAIAPNLEHGRAYYLAQLDLMDRAIGRMLDHLEATGRRENTLVVYLTDNGGSRCNVGDNTPLTGGKYSLYEGGVRVPFIVSWPGITEPGRRSDALVSSLDLMPTFAAAAGARRPSILDGMDLRPVLEEERPHHEVLHFDVGFQWAVRTPAWKLRWVEPGTPMREAMLSVEHTDIGEGLSLVPIGDSPDESPAADVADRHPDVVRDLIARHRAWRRELDAPRTSTVCP